VLVSLVGTAVETAVLAALDERGLGGVKARHGYVFQRLLEGPATATEMARSLEISQQAMSKTVRELAGLGYVRETSDPADGRRSPVELTDAGREVVAVSRRTRRSLESRLRRRVGASRADEAAEVLRAMLDLLDLGGPVRTRTVRPPAGTF